MSAGLPLKPSNGPSSVKRFVANAVGASDRKYRSAAKGWCAIVALAAALASSAQAGTYPSSSPAQPTYDALHLGYWVTAHQGFVARAKRGHVPVLFLGDSITENWLTVGKDAWDASFAPRGAVNFGIGGDKTQNLLWRVSNGELDGLAPKSVVLLIGANNLIDGSAATIEGVRAAVEGVRSRLPSSAIHVIALLPIGGNLWRIGVRDVPGINAAIASVAGGNVTFHNLDPVFANADGTQNFALFQPDQIHLSPAGYRAFAAALVPILSADR